MNPIPKGFVVPMGTTKPPEMGFVGHREVSLKNIPPFAGGGPLGAPPTPGKSAPQGPQMGGVGPMGDTREGYRYGPEMTWGGIRVIFYDCFRLFKHILSDFEISRFL